MIREPDGDILIEPPLADDPRQYRHWLAPWASRPLEIDIGCGKGRFLVTRAKETPERNFLGIERRMDRIRRTVRKIERAGLENVRIVKLDAEYVFAHLLPKHCVHAVYLFFPDPWPKRRHHQRRLFSSLFTDTLCESLAPGGVFQTVTDHRDYFDRIQKTLSVDPRFQPCPPMHRDADHQTEFERLFIAKGIPIHACAFMSRESVRSAEADG